MAEQRTLIVWDRLGDYHRARVEAYEDLVGKKNVFTADLGSADKLYGWETSDNTGNHFILSSKPVDERDILVRAKGFRNLLKKHGISQVAIAGYAHPEYFLFLLLARLSGCRIVMFGESWYGKGKFKNFIKGLFLRIFVDAFFLSGSRACEHFHNQLGIPKARILDKYSIVDNQHFSQKSGNPRERVLLCVARFSPEKNLVFLIEAFQASRLSKTHRLRIIGGGPDKQKLQSLVDDRKSVELIDWVRYTDLPAEYGRARFFILPSIFEPWGLVVNEAMAGGLPVIASDACGCVPDLVTEKNGFVFPAKEKDELIHLLDELDNLSESSWEKMSVASLQVISGYSCAVWAEQLRKGFLENAHH